MKTHSDFVHLHVHTQYSLLDGACSLERLVDKAVQYRLPALSITDHGNLFGAVKFYSLCLKKGIKPILGSEVYIAPGGRLKKEGKISDEGNCHLLLLAKDEEGYSNLVKLISLANLEGFYYKPRIDRELLQRYSAGLIALSACLKGEIPTMILRGDSNGAYKKADEYLSLFGKGNFYLELMDNGMKEQQKVNAELVKISRDLNIPLVATNDIHYLNRDESFAHEVLLCLQTQTTLLDPNRLKFSSDTFYFRSPQEMKELFREFPEAIKNTIEIAQKCNVTFDFSRIHLPHFPLPPGEESEDSFLRKLCQEGLCRCYPGSGKEVQERLEYELGVISQMGFSSYFLIVWDLISFAKQEEIPVGPGRGSAAGSIVSYLLGITDIDPLKYQLIFERFLNPQRISMPDIDMDFCYENRQRILEYVSQRYGKENVAQIITYGTLQARAAVRDVGRVIGMSYAEVDRIAKMIPHGLGAQISLREALTASSELKTVYEGDERVKRLIDTAIKLEGLSRHSSTHAAGVVISDKPLMDRIPLSRGSEGEVITGMDMSSLEKVGMLKMDFLGLKTLTVIEQTKKIIRRVRSIDVDISSIPLDDARTFSLLSQGNTIGVFQLESSGMRDILQKMSPTEFRDLIAVLALYRPGPLGSGLVSDFIERKLGKKPIRYLHPRLESLLKETYGIILYQEQTMRIVHDLAGFSLAQADLLRKAIGKKIPEIMQEQRSMFIEGCKKNRIAPAVSAKIFDLIEYFSGYGFNKSHSTAYALITYRTAYLKANYPVEFMAALLTSERTNTDKIVEYIHEARQMGIQVLPPDINTSFANFTVTDRDNIRFGLLAVKNVGEAALENIINVRKERLFDDFFDFCQRVDSRAVNKKVIESLIKCGAMDSLGLRRSQMATVLDDILEKNNRRSREDSRQLLFFEEPAPSAARDIPDIEEWPLQQILQFEKQLLGIYLSSHPLHSYEKMLKLFGVRKIKDLYDMTRSEEVIVAGIIENVKKLTTRRTREEMAVIKIEDDTFHIETLLFPKVYEVCQPCLTSSTAVLVQGTLEPKERVPKVLANRLLLIDDLWPQVKEVKISLKDKTVNLKGLKEILLGNKGDTPVGFVLDSKKFPNVRVKASQSFRVRLDQQVIESIASIVGRENLSLTL